MDCCQRSPVAPFTVTSMIPTYGEESVKSGSEASGFLVVPLVFKTRERRAASLAGSIPVRLRHQRLCRVVGVRGRFVQRKEAVGLGAESDVTSPIGDRDPGLTTPPRPDHQGLPAQP